MVPGIQSTGSVVAAHELRCSTARGIFLGQGSSPCPLHHQESPSSPCLTAVSIEGGSLCGCAHTCSWTSAERSVSVNLAFSRPLALKASPGCDCTACLPRPRCWSALFSAYESPGSDSMPDRIISVASIQSSLLAFMLVKVLFQF